MRVKTIKRVVANHYGLQEEDLNRRTRMRPIARPRQVAMYFCRKLTANSYKRIAMYFSLTDSSTSMAAVKSIERLMAADEDFKDEIARIQEGLENAGH